MYEKQVDVPLINPGCGNPSDKNDDSSITKKRKRLPHSDAVSRAKVVATVARRKLNFDSKGGVEKSNINKFDVILKEMCELRRDIQRDMNTLGDDLRKEMSVLRRDQKDSVTGFINHLTAFSKSNGIMYLVIISSCSTPWSRIHKY